MRPVLKAFLLFLGFALVVVGAGLLYVVNRGVSAKEQPGRLEEFIAGRVRNIKGADGSWKIRHSHTSSRPARRPAA